MSGPLWTPGASLAPLEATATEIDLFRFSAATWNAHRIHYDRRLAEAEGLPGLVVQAHLQGAWFARLARSIAGPSARLRELSWTNRMPVTCGERVELTGTVREVTSSHGSSVVDVAMLEAGPDGATRADASARVEIPHEEAR